MTDFGLCLETGSYLRALSVIGDRKLHARGAVAEDQLQVKKVVNNLLLSDKYTAVGRPFESRIGGAVPKIFL
jgi:hypothetical protein